MSYSTPSSDMPTTTPRPRTNVAVAVAVAESVDALCTLQMLKAYRCRSMMMSQTLSLAFAMGPF